jgi:hypothetical protein
MTLKFSKTQPYGFQIAQLPSGYRTFVTPRQAEALKAQQSFKPLPGQWWERMGYVVFLHPTWNPNDDPDFTGWTKVTQERAREVLEQNARRYQ